MPTPPPPLTRPGEGVRPAPGAWARYGAWLALRHFWASQRAELSAVAAGTDAAWRATAVAVLELNDLGVLRGVLAMAYG